MTKLNWDKAGEYVPDPGAVVEVPDFTRPHKLVSAEEAAQRRQERYQQEQARVERARRMETYKWLDPVVREIKRRKRTGDWLSLVDECNLKRWQELRRQLGF